MKKLTKITFSIYSKRNAKRFQHTIYSDGHLTMTEITNQQSQYVKARDILNTGLRFEGTKIEYYESVEISCPVS